MSHNQELFKQLIPSIETTDEAKPRAGGQTKKKEPNTFASRFGVKSGARKVPCTGHISEELDAEIKALVIQATQSRNDRVTKSEVVEYVIEKGLEAIRAGR